MLTPASLRCLLPLGRKKGLSLLQTCRITGTQGRLTAGAAAAGVTEGEKRYKTFDDLPGPNLLTSIYWVFLKGYWQYSHELQGVFKKKYGPIWKTTLGRYKVVNVVDVDLVETILRKEGNYPIRNDMELWKIYRRMRDLELGPFTVEGHRWKTLRTVLNTRMLKPGEALLYTDYINEVVTDFLLRLDELRENSSSGVMVEDVLKAMYRFAFEGISYILFETRIGCLEKQISPDTQGFIDSIGGALKYAVLVTFFPQWTKSFLPIWDRYIAYWDHMFHFGKVLIDNKMNSIQERLDRGEEVKGEYLTYLLSSGKLTVKEVYSSVTELLLAGVDTTSNTLTWTMFLLSKHPEIQDQLFKEVSSVIPGRKIPTSDDINNMPLLKAVIRESLRIYPAVATNSRVVVEKPMVVGDYCFPEGTQFTLGHYQIAREEANFPEPTKFIPQRWFRDQRVKNNPFSAIPFGHGIRACVGRRIAELEMYLALSRIIQKYEIKPDPKGAKIRSVARLALVPNKPIRLEFHVRDQWAAHSS
ncbi:sterol 26-hydroxylase, mitochondrial-like [Pelobates cultripes]|uniref:Sterol 26-hydroxylase, mitochondrial-like n=1 Tax=Pelobates cultripes TaxID=61616 RepID=A0AAD1SL59_PELCU|nr:sterol 26-hydroxylase, mitochondrial-like [Pelobates cultripes]